jgi:H+-translocating NAD(P) transhydrogenase subunit alpha
MIIAIVKEPAGETRVALLPEAAGQLVKMKCEVWIENDAGENAFASDKDYIDAGCKIESRDLILTNADCVIGISSVTDNEISKLKNGAIVIAVLQPLFHKERVQALVQQKITSFSLDMMPRTTRAQAMDILSSQATVAGYQAVLIAAAKLPRFFPLFITAAGSVKPAKVLILGAGVAGLQAIATAKRLGAVVEAFDTRTAVKEEVQSLGAKFIEVEGAADSKAAGGYAVEQTKEFQEKQKQKIAEHVAKADVIITTAQIPGRRAPVLVTKEMVNTMTAGSVIVDLAASTGGNCEVTENDKTIEFNQVSIIGNSNLPGSKPSDASKMFGKNVLNFIKLLIDKDGNFTLNFNDDLVKGSCITHNGEIVNDAVSKIVNTQTL